MDNIGLDGNHWRDEDPEEPEITSDELCKHMVSNLILQNGITVTLAGPAKECFAFDLCINDAKDGWNICCALHIEDVVLGEYSLFGVKGHPLGEICIDGKKFVRVDAAKTEAAIMALPPRQRKALVEEIIGPGLQQTLSVEYGLTGAQYQQLEDEIQAACLRLLGSDLYKTQEDEELEGSPAETPEVTRPVWIPERQKSAQIYRAFTYILQHTRTQLRRQLPRQYHPSIAEIFPEITSAIFDSDENDEIFMLLKAVKETGTEETGIWIDEAEDRWTILPSFTAAAINSIRGPKGCEYRSIFADEVINIILNNEDHLPEYNSPKDMRMLHRTFVERVDSEQLQNFYIDLKTGTLNESIIHDTIVNDF